MKPVQRLLDLGVRAFGAVPYGASARIAAVIGRCGYTLYLPERRLALWNLRYCYPDRSPGWQAMVAERFFEHVVLSAYEVFHTVTDPQGTLERVCIENVERLDAALAQGRGVIVVAGHFGNFALLPFILRSASPETAYIARASKRRVGPLIAACRAYYREALKPLAGMRVLPNSIGGALTAARLLRRGNLIILFSDLTWGTGEVSVCFLGVPHNVSRAPAALALRTGAVLLPVITMRLPDGRQRVVVAEPIDPPAECLPREQVEQRMMERFSAALEVYVRARPEQWYWLHRSWRPAGGGS